MKHIVIYSFLLVLYILYLYDVQFRFFPFNMQFIVGNLGLVVAIKYLISDNYKFRREYIWYIMFPFTIIAWDLYTCSVNDNFELILSKNVVGAIRSLFGAFFLFLISKSQIKNVQEFHRLIVLAVLLESLLCVTIKFSPIIYNFIDYIQEFNTGNANVDDIENYKRFVGIGNAVFFGVLRTSTFGLISAVYLINIRKKIEGKLFYILSFLIISLISFLVARTVLLIIAISVLLLLLYQRHLSAKTRLCIIAFLFIFIYICYEITLLYIPENVLAWGFGTLDRSDTSSSSIDNVLNWLFNTSFDIGTFLIGDAHYVDNSGGYYMGVDIGLYRRIFYAGIIGLTLSLYYHYKTIRSINKYDRSFDCNLLSLSLFICYLVILFKGDTSLIQYYVLYLVFYSKGIFYYSSDKSETKYISKEY